MMLEPFFKGCALRNGSFLWVKIDISHLQLLIVVQDEYSCGKRETGSAATRRLTVRPRKAKSCMEIKSGLEGD
jgi:hypothetical protein